MVNFAIVYGVSPYGLAKRIGMDVKETRKSSTVTLRTTKVYKPTWLA